MQEQLQLQLVSLISRNKYVDVVCCWLVGWGAIVENVAEAMATIDRHLYLHNGFWKFHFHCNCGHDGRSGCVCFVMLCCCFCCLHTHLPLRLPFKCSIVYNCQILSWIQFLLLLLVPSVYIFVCVCVCYSFFRFINFYHKILPTSFPSTNTTSP